MWQMVARGFVSVSGSRGEQGGRLQHGSSMHQIYLVTAAVWTTGSITSAVSLLLLPPCEGHSSTDSTQQPSMMLH